MKISRNSRLISGPAALSMALLTAACLFLCGSSSSSGLQAGPDVSADEMNKDGHGVILNIGMCLIAASVLGLLMRFARQPLILGYILAGVIIGPVGFGLIMDHSEIITIAEIGLILLLFMIGMEIDLHKMLSSGKMTLVPGVLQFPACLGVSYLLLALMERMGLTLEPDSYSRVYVAAGISLSSTMIVVKLLYEKFELDTLPGRITLGILVFQDIWAILILAVQPNLSNPNAASLLRTFGSGGLLILGAFLFSKFLLPRVFRAVAKIPELMLVMSLGWCFLISLIAAHPKVGLSMEMGALIAGVSLATFPYNLDVNAKVLSLRDFFITLFFVSLGMQIPVPGIEMIIAALCIALVALLARIAGVFGILSCVKSGHRNAILPTLNLSQVSEFSLVIVSLGIVYGHIGADTLSLIIWVFSILAIVSTYLIDYSHELQSLLGRLLKVIGWDDLSFDEEESEKPCDHSIVILGFYRIASAFVHDVAEMRPDLLSRIKVIDFNPASKQALDKMGVACVYGDISHLNTLRHANIHDAKIVLSTVPDEILRGISNRKIVDVIRELCPHAHVFAVSERPDKALALYEAGADYVIQPSKCSGTAAYYAIESALRGDITALKDSEVLKTMKRKEVLA